MNVELQEGEARIDDEVDIVKVRKLVREAAHRIGFGVTDVTRIVTAASELARNVYRYAGSGTMHWRLIIKNTQVGIELIFEDKGPGISDIGQAMGMGYTSGGGLGMGLPGVKRLMSEMEIQSEVGCGTIIKVIKWIDNPLRP